MRWLQPPPMRTASFSKHTKPWGSLTRIKHLGLQALETLLIFVGDGSYTAHALHDVEHHALGLQKRAHLAFYLKGHIAGLYTGTVVDIHCHLELGVEFLKHLAGHLHSGEDTLLLDYETLSAALSVGNSAECGVITVTYILSKCEVRRSSISWSFVFIFIRIFAL